LEGGAPSPPTPAAQPPFLFIGVTALGCRAAAASAITPNPRPNRAGRLQRRLRRLKLRTPTARHPSLHEWRSRTSIRIAETLPSHGGKKIEKYFKKMLANTGGGELRKNFTGSMPFKTQTHIKTIIKHQKHK
jgi:hypothetical protein